MRGPLKTILAFVVVNFASIIVNCLGNKDKLATPPVVAPMIKKISEMNLPKAIRKPLFKFYGKVYGVDFEEIKKPLETHESFISFFTR